VTPPDLPRVVIDDEDDPLVELLREAQLALLRHPVASQTAIRALVAEGRRFARTPDGRRWAARLAGSELVRRGRAAWEGSALGMFEETSDTMLPSSLVDAIVSVLARVDPSGLMRGVLEE
jgi:hypothetical protein